MAEEARTEEDEHIKHHDNIQSVYRPIGTSALLRHGTGASLAPVRSDMGRFGN